MFFFDRCQSKYAWALSAVLRLHTVEVPDPANWLVHRVELPDLPQTVLPPRAGRAPARAGSPFRYSARATEGCGAIPVAVQGGPPQRAADAASRFAAVRQNRAGRWRGAGDRTAAGSPADAGAGPLPAGSAVIEAARRAGKEWCSADCTVVTRRGTMFDRRGAAEAVRGHGTPLARPASRASHHHGAACRGGVPAARQRGEPEGISQGTFLARQSIRRSGMRNAGENDRWRKDR